MRHWLVFRVVAVLLFGVFALVQWNDPDPLAWIAVYGFAATAAAVAAFGQRLGQRPLVGRVGRVGRVVLGALAIVCTAWMATLLPGLLDFLGRGDLSLLTQSMRAEAPEIEYAREFLGLALVVLYALVELTFGSSHSR